MAQAIRAAQDSGSARDGLAVSFSFSVTKRCPAKVQAFARIWRRISSSVSSRPGRRGFHHGIIPRLVAGPITADDCGRAWAITARRAEPASATLRRCHCVIVGATDVPELLAQYP